MGYKSWELWEYFKSDCWNWESDESHWNGDVCLQHSACGPHSHSGILQTQAHRKDFGTPDTPFCLTEESGLLFV